MILWWCLVLLLQRGSAFWDMGTTTAASVREDTVPRQSFFRWQIVHFERYAWWFTNWDWYTIRHNRKLAVICGLSIDFLPLGTGTLLNQRTIVSSANFLEPYIYRQRDVRIWALGREGIHTTPYRYRVWRIRRVLPKSLNPEHWHGPRGVHVMRHDITVIHSFDQIYIYSIKSTRYLYAQRAFLVHKHERLGEELWFAGSGFEYVEHIVENYKIFFGNQTRDDVVDCSRYLPKWWGKFICIINTHSYAGVPNGGGLFIKAYDDRLVGLGCFEIRSTRYLYAQRAFLVHKHERLGEELWFAGSGFEYVEHIVENYKIFFGNQTRDDVVDCSRYLPKWWGKFICIINTHSYAGVPNGGGLFIKAYDDRLVGLGCFEIRYNEDRIMVFTDLRYYMDLIETFCNISYGEYYEYAYPQWSIRTKWHGLYDDMANNPYIPYWQLKWHTKPYG